MGSKRTSEGERRLSLLVAEQQAQIAVAQVRIEQLGEMVATLGAAITRVLSQPPFTKPEQGQ